MRSIELLSPAKNLTCGIEAIRHGADAVYIGGPAFGARQAAGNSIEDISELCQYAHIFNVKVYVALNTILYEDELEEAQEVAYALYKVGVDALIVQDAALLELDLPPIALHASTQMDNRTPEKACRLEVEGFSQIVLARELSLQEISEIHHATSLPLEAFVHGALCVSYSGRCYASQYCFGRSANRGNCAQFCRLAFDLVDEEGTIIVQGKHLLSLRDMNRSASLEAMMDAGISSFKIEGRLKDIDYVKNVTAFYRREIDRILTRRSEDFFRSSWGTTVVKGFIPKLERSFNRGFTDYFLHGRDIAPICNVNTPKAMGEKIGRVKSVLRGSFTMEYISDDVKINAGDGLCFIDKNGELQGFRVNTVAGQNIVPPRMPVLFVGAVVYRNHDHEFNKALQNNTAVRKLSVSIRLEELDKGYELTMFTRHGRLAGRFFECGKEVAQTPQCDNIKRVLSKLGDTPFECHEVVLSTQGERFIPSSLLADWRRQVVQALLMTIREKHVREKRRSAQPAHIVLPDTLDYSANVANSKADAFYRSRGVRQVEPAFELGRPQGKKCLMTCRFCLRHAMGACLKNKKEEKARRWALRLPDGRRFPLEFNCKDCIMTVHAPQ